MAQIQHSLAGLITPCRSDLGNLKFVLKALESHPSLHDVQWRASFERASYLRAMRP